MSSDVTNIHSSASLLVHCFFINAGFNCTGIQEDDIKTDNVLPSGWLFGDKDKLYSFRYEDSNDVESEIYVKMLGLNEATLVVNAIRSKNLE
jgi:hypothetical protein